MNYQQIMDLFDTTLVEDDHTVVVLRGSCRRWGGLLDILRYYTFGSINILSGMSWHKLKREVDNPKFYNFYTPHCHRNVDHHAFVSFANDYYFVMILRDSGDFFHVKVACDRSRRRKHLRQQFNFMEE